MTRREICVVVLVSVGRNPVSGTARASRADLAALALGQSLAGARVRCIHVGNAAEPALRDYLAFGADAIEVVQRPDDRPIERVLEPLIKSADIVITGARAETCEGSGLLPFLIGHLLSRPVIGDVLSADVHNDSLTARQFLPKGQRRRIGVSLPLVLSAHASLASKLKYAYARRIAGHIKPISAPQSLSGGTPQWTVLPAERRFEVLRAVDNRNGHERMMDATTARERGGRIVRDGSPVDKAQVIFNYLCEHKLANF